MYAFWTMCKTKQNFFGRKGKSKSEKNAVLRQVCTVVFRQMKKEKADEYNKLQGSGRESRELQAQP